MIITLQLEQKLTKEEIFEDYANQIYLGWRGTFRIHGFGEAAEAYFGKDLSQITLPEAATLAGMIQRPAYSTRSAIRTALRERRNVVLGLMRQNGYITDREYALAVEAPLTVAKGAASRWTRPYFVDLVNDTLQSKFQDPDFQSNAFRDLHHARYGPAARGRRSRPRSACRAWTSRSSKQRRFRGQTPPEAQVALVALDPHTGEVKALVGGRNYGMSQLNHVLAKRQPGSIFKPFVYAAALDTALEGGPHVLTAVHHGGGRAHHVLVRRQALRAQQFQARVPTARSRCARRWRIP